MIAILKHLKTIACSLIMLIMFQSCVVYKSKPISIQEASEYKKTKMKILTKKGDKYKFKEIKEKGGNVEFTKKPVKHIVISKLMQINTMNNDQISLDSAYNHEGFLKVTAINYRGDSYTIKLSRIEFDGDKLIGYRTTKKHPAPVILPKDQIKEIKVKNKALSAVGTILVVVIAPPTALIVGLVLYDYVPLY